MPNLNPQAGANALLGADGPTDGLEVYRYPNSVGQDEYPHYMMFYVFTRTSDIGTENVARRNGGAITADLSRANRADRQTFNAGIIGATAFTGAKIGAKYGAEAADLVMTVSGAKTAAYAAGSAEILANKVEAENLLATGKSIGQGIGALSFGTLALGGISGAAKSNERVLLKKVVALYMPSSPSVSYQASWAGGDLGYIGEAGAGIGRALQGIQALGSSAMSAATPSKAGFLERARGIAEGVTGAVRGVGSMLSTGADIAAAISLRNANKIFGDIGNVQNTFSATNRTAVNPFKAQLFNNMGFRTFSFTYKFLPKSPDEYKEVQQIIKIFKTYMHPSSSPNEVFIGYPAEFAIHYYYKTKENEELFKVSNCALTNMKVSYGNEDFVTFKEDVSGGGKPAEITIALSFTELELLTQSRVQEGY